uniref:Ovule protein n=1 Tax=Loa loa TaxID=7209 RepID=A0A1I7VXT9_LOALO
MIQHDLEVHTSRKTNKTPFMSPRMPPGKRQTPLPHNPPAKQPHPKTGNHSGSPSDFSSLI